MNIKPLLIEKEREAYVRGDTAQARFYADVLDHIIELEELINTKDAGIEAALDELGA